ncbi:MAG: AMP-binding protein, partial [Clostridia bacterium]|nr:AMP-binding protein [Clostridia bacterium]
MKTYNNLKPVAAPEEVLSFKQMIEKNISKYGEKALYIYKDKGEMCEKTYGEFGADVKSFSTFLYEKGLAGKRIAIIGDTHPAWLTAFYATIIAGGVVVPLDRELDADQMAEFINIAECSAIVYTEALNEKVEGTTNKLEKLDYFIPVRHSGYVDSRVLPFDQAISEGASLVESGDTRFEEQETDLDRLAAILFTSGTTGTSKGVMLSYKNFVSCANACCRSMQYDCNDVFVSVLPIHHTYELSTIQISGSNLGATIVICEGVRYATRYFKEYKPTAVVLVPLFLETIHKKIWSEIKKKGMEKKVRAGMKISDALLKTGVDIRPKLFSDITSVFGGNLKSIVAGGAPLDPQIVK